MRGREKFEKYRVVINMIVHFYSLLPSKLLNKLLVLFRKQSGNIGLLNRYCLLKCIASYVGDNVSIHPDVYLFNVDKLSIGDNVSIHPMTYIEAFGGVNIGNDVSIAHGVTIMSTSHIFEDREVLIKDQGIKIGTVDISNNVWIGEKAVILSGICIQEGCVVGSGSVVTKNTEVGEVVAGVPAKVIRRR